MGEHSGVSRRGTLMLLGGLPLLLAGDRPPRPHGRPTSCGVTPKNPQGPYYRPNAPMGDALLRDVNGRPLQVRGRIYGADCGTPIAAAMLDLWQTDSEGRYDYQLVGRRLEPEQYRFRGRIRADEDGRYAFTTVLPGHYGSRPRHIHVKVTAPGYPTLTTQIYFHGDPQIRGNRVVARPLVVRLSDDGDRLRGRFDIVLARAGGRR